MYIYITTRISSLMEQIDCRFACALKAAAVSCGDLPALLCENELVMKSAAEGTKGQIEPAVLTAWNAARTSCNKILTSTNRGDGASVVSYFAKKEASLRSIDPAFCIEMRFTGAASQGVVLNVSSLVVVLMEGRKPKFASNPSDFLKDTKLRLAFFCRATTTTADEGTSELSGAAAGSHLAEEALQKGGLTTVADLEGPTEFSWLLDQSTADRVSTARATAIAATVATFRDLDAGKAASCSKRGAASSSGAAGQPDKKGRVGASEVDAAMAMFRGMT
jgi:hypothetical protein